MEGFSTAPNAGLRGQTALVTGGSRGIGRAACVELARAGVNIAVHYHQNGTAAAAVADECAAFGVKSMTVQANLARPEEIRQLYATLQSFEPISILVNNAAIARTELFTDITLDSWMDTLNTNLTSAFLCTQTFLPGMLSKRYGRIINLASVWGITGGACETAYSASKGGLIAMTKALAKELAQTGITVNAVAPGAIDTDMLADLDETDRAEVIREIPMQRLGQPSEIAHCIRFLASPDASYLTGQVISPNGGWWM